MVANSILFTINKGNMLKSLIQLVPFGIDENSKVISGFYIANTGYSDMDSDGTNFDYVIGYFEKASRFTDNKPVAKVLFIEDWCNNQGTFALMQEIFGRSEHCWWNINSILLLELCNSKQFQAIEIFKQRAKEDGIYQ
jgi:hypothetical protein